MVYPDLEGQALQKFLEDTCPIKCDEIEKAVLAAAEKGKNICSREKRRRGKVRRFSPKLNKEKALEPLPENLIGSSEQRIEAITDVAIERGNLDSKKDKNEALIKPPKGP